GNNLIALSSLLKRYEGKVKCIYIDPPYYFIKNKPADSFKYNSNFKLSSWLSFMKNRLEVSYKLLKEQGVLFCHIGEEGVHWMKVLLEELFGEENFVETFIWKNTDNPDSLSPKSRSAVEYIICYEKNKNNSIGYKGKNSENGDAPLLNSGNSIHSLVFPPQTIKFNIADGIYSGKPDRVEIYGECIVENGTNKNTVTLIGEFKWGQEMLNDEIKKGTYFLVKSSKFSIRFQRKEATTMAPEKFIEEQYLSKTIGVGTNEDATSHLKNMGLTFSYSKPESVISFLINATTEENDLILDFHLGSGTTCAVAHKMGRSYIGVEQMDYIEDITVERMKKVIDGEQGGISKSVNWQGGGSFVYCELMENANTLIEKIQAASNETINSIKDEIYADERIVPYITREELKEADEAFVELELEDKKKALIALVDKNKLYVNYSDMNDESYAVSEIDKEFTESFYAEV
ncbi:MAG: site-specific DNA-methyltransferase, partial [Peptoniphilus sp.]|nr:site-specific DNA-methyltransferase [Peptoniphilus sp.]